MRIPVKDCSFFILACGAILLGGCQSNGSAETAAPAETTAIGELPGQDAVPSAGIEKLNLNTATEDQLLTIPNVGDRMVHEFEEYRPYISIRQFRREIGKYVDEEQVAAYEQHVFVPVSPNESDEETLMQLPGVDAEEAAELAAARPYDSDEAFLEKLGEFATTEEVERAEFYLASP